MPGALAPRDVPRRRRGEARGVAAPVLALPGERLEPALGKVRRDIEELQHWPRHLGEGPEPPLAMHSDGRRRNPARRPGEHSARLGQRVRLDLVLLAFVVWGGGVWHRWDAQHDPLGLEALCRRVLLMVEPEPGLGARGLLRSRHRVLGALPCPTARATVQCCPAVGVEAPPGRAGVVRRQQPQRHLGHSVPALPEAGLDEVPPRPLQEAGLRLRGRIHR
mmetsp:Transcript_52440/g.147168  ORF Transcript_52440/g.147168 Transcript_52440/m.147168 type:complete len:220 (-) Transcript_52440:290-949(-)